MMQNPRLFNLTLAGLFALIIVAPITYLVTDRSPPYVYLSGEVVPPEAGAGDELSVYWTVKINHFCPGWVERYVTDHRGYMWRNIGSPVKSLLADKPGNTALIANTFQLPRGIGAGDAIYQAHVCYRCNTVQDHLWPLCLWTPQLKFVVK